jgi:hypothetical protein
MGVILDFDIATMLGRYQVGDQEYLVHRQHDDAGLGGRVFEEFRPMITFTARRGARVDVLRLDDEHESAWVRPNGREWAYIVFADNVRMDPETPKVRAAIAPVIADLVARERAADPTGRHRRVGVAADTKASLTKRIADREAQVRKRAMDRL